MFVWVGGWPAGLMGNKTKISSSWAEIGTWTELGNSPGLQAWMNDALNKLEKQSASTIVLFAF